MNDELVDDSEALVDEAERTLQGVSRACGVDHDAAEKSCPSTCGRRAVGEQHRQRGTRKIRCACVVPRMKSIRNRFPKSVGVVKRERNLVASRTAHWLTKASKAGNRP